MAIIVVFYSNSNWGVSYFRRTCISIWIVLSKHVALLL